MRPQDKRAPRGGVAPLSILTGALLLGLGVSCSEGSPGDGGTDGAGAQASTGGMGTAGAGPGQAGSGTGGSVEDLEDINDVGPAEGGLACDQDGPLATGPLLKLSTVQYRNTVRDLLRRVGLETVLQDVEPLLLSIPDDSLGDSFRALDDRIAIEHVQGFFNVGVLVGDAVLADPELLAAVAGECAVEPELSTPCWDDFLASFMTLVHRRPVLDSERELYAALDDGSRSAAEVVRAAIVVALSSPRFLYQVEVDGALLNGRPDLLELDAYEVASRLSYTFWQTMPDDELFSLAEDGSLLDPAVYGEQLLRVWGDPRTRATVEQFYSEWLRLEKFTGFETTRPAFMALTDGEHFGEPGHDHYGDMVDEVVDLTTLFTFEREGTLRDLLTTDLSVTTSTDLASLYGVVPWDGTGPYPTLSDRAGLLQRAALLVSNLEQTNPFHRGALVRRAILCDDLPQPNPNDLPPGALDPPPFDVAQTTRQRFNAKVDGNALCMGCHNTFSDIGYVLESFDAVGRFRTTERVFDEQTGELLAQLPIETSGDVEISASDEDPVGDATELNQRIVDSGKVELCLAERYFSYAARRAKDSSSLDACVIEDLGKVLSGEEGGLAAAFRRIAEMPTFFTRKVGAQ